MLAAGVSALGAGAYSLFARGTVDCPSSRHAIVVVDTGKHTMALCESGTRNAERTFTVRIGSQGTGKSREGDEKTPLGTYRLGSPRASATYGIFVPIEYPTPDQRKAGFTGGAVGVHGPGRSVRWLGPFVNTFDTTDGCVGIATVPEMRAVATWIHEHGARDIVIQ